MCLTGVDYFSTLGYQPSIGAQAAIAAAVSAGVAGNAGLSPIATLILVAITIFGALPMYKQVAVESPHGAGSLAIIEKMLPGWKRVIVMLGLIAFVMLAFLITITLSAADATKHLAENELTKQFVIGQEVFITNILIGVLGGIFLLGFTEAIVVAIPIVAVFILGSAVIGVTALLHVVAHPSLISAWSFSLASLGSTPFIIGSALLLFPKLALGMSGFETGNVVAPLVKGDPTDDLDQPAGRIANTQKLLTWAARIMAVMLILSSFTTAWVVPAEAFLPEHTTVIQAQEMLQRPVDEALLSKADGRALSYVAHTFIGEPFATVYDFFTVLILWFAGASAMAGLLNITPGYLPRYGMAPEWARARRPLVIIFTIVCTFITMAYQAQVTPQAGPYATGVLVLFTSAAIAVTLSARKRNNNKQTWGFGFVALILLYTTCITIWKQPEGLAIGFVMFFVIWIISWLSRIIRAFELRAEGIEIGPNASALIERLKCNDHISIVCNKPPANGGTAEYLALDIRTHKLQHIPEDRTYITLEAITVDPSVFKGMITVVLGDVEYAGHTVLRCYGVAVPNTIAAVVKYLNEATNAEVHVNMEGTYGNPIRHAWEYLLYGLGDTGRVTAFILEKELNKLMKNGRRHVQIHVTYDI
jgi:hypothetical protein